MAMPLRNTDPNQSPLYTSPYAGQVTDPSQMPVMPGYNSTYNPNTMSLGNDMSSMLAGTNQNTQPLQQLAANAESTQASPWAQLQSQLARNQTAQGMSTVAGQTAGSTANAEGNLAMSGGLSSGANERLQESGQAAGIGAQQGVQNQGNTNLLNIGSQDAAQKQQEMMALPGMETQAYQASLEPIQMMGQAQAQDVAHEGANLQGLNNFNMSAYGNQAGMYGAGQTADAEANAAAGQSGWLGLGQQANPYTLLPNGQYVPAAH